MYIMDKAGKEQLHVLVSAQEKEAFVAAAHRAGMNFSTWLRDRLLKAALKEKKEA